MEIVNNEFSRRIQEIDRYFSFLKQVNDQRIKIQTETGSKNLENQLAPTLRASAVLLLYNLLESTVIQTIDNIHIMISTKFSLTYKEAIDELKKIWIEYQYNNFKGTEKGSEQIFNDLKFLENDIINIFSEKAKNNTEYLHKVKGVAFSGKIDALQIKKFAKKYGFGVNKRVEGKNLVQIKNQRNALAHGELSFNECGNNYNYEQLLKLKKEAVLFLREFLNNVEKYLIKEEFRSKDYSAII
jgi:hypothetical protein